MADQKTLELQIKLIAQQATNQLQVFAKDIKEAAAKANGFTGSAKSVSSTIKNLQSESTRAANSLKLFGGSVSELKNTTQKMKSTILDLIDSGLKPESDEVQNLVKQYKELDQQITDSAETQDGLLGVISKLKKEVGSLATVTAAVALDKALANVGQTCLDVADTFQGAKDDFGIMLGDMQAGSGFFNELQEFNFWTPFDIEQTSQAAKVLMAAKVPLAEITEYLTRFGDIAQGNAQRFQSFITAYSKAAAKGKADMEVLNVYIDQGVLILDALAEQMNVTTNKIVDMSSKGQISFQDLDNALASLAAKGGIYYNSLATASQRYSAVQAGLQESAKSLAASYGDLLVPLASEFLILLTNILDAINKSPLLKGILLGAVTALATGINILAVKSIFKLITNLGLGKLAANAFGIAVTGATGKVGLLSVAMKSVLGPIGLVSAALGLVVGIYTSYQSKKQEAADIANEHALALHKENQEIQNQMAFLNNLSLAKLEDVLASYTNKVAATTEEVNSLQEQLNNTAPKVETTGTKKITEYNGNKKGAKLKYVNTIIEVDNPEYSRIQKELNQANKKLESYKKAASATAAKISEVEKKAVEDAVRLGTEWQDKLETGINTIEEKRNKSIEKLNNKAKDIYGENYKQEDAYQNELLALNEYYNNEKLKAEQTAAEKIAAQQQKLAEKKAAVIKKSIQKYKETIQQAKDVISDWMFFGDEISQLETEQQKELKKLSDAAQMLYNDDYKKSEEYVKAKYNLEKYYQEKIFEDKMQKQAEYWESESKKASMNMQSATKWTDFIGSSGLKVSSEFANSIQGTDFGSVLNTLSNAGKGASGAFEMLSGAANPLISAFVECMLEIENVQKIVNWAGTVMSKVFNIIGPIINDYLEPLVKLLETLGDTVGKIIAPFAEIFSLMSQLNPIIIILTEILKLLGKGFEWLYNKVIVPVGNKIVDIANSLIDILNKIPGVEIAKLKKLEVIGDMAVEAAETAEKQNEMIKKKYQRMQSAVDVALDAQLDALRSQYELGLITRQEYQAQAEKYAQEADSRIYDINKEMEKHLAAIEDGTEDIQDVLNELEIPAVTGEQIAMSTAPETEPRKKLIEEMTKGAFYSSNQAVNVTVNVAGSVMTEQELINSLYTGIAKGIQQRKFSPLTGA